MKTIKNSKEITTLEVGDEVVFGNFTYVVTLRDYKPNYYLYCYGYTNNIIFNSLNLNIENFCSNLGIQILNVFDLHDGSFPETKSLEALTVIVSALFKEYEKQNELPKTWEEFCEKYPIKAKEAYITTDSEVCDLKNHINALNSNLRHHNFDKNICISKQDAEAHLALMQLRQLRKAYVKNWEPDLGKKEYYGIVYTHTGIKIGSYQWNHRSLSFPTYELAKQFLTNFKDLLEIAKPLL